MLDRLHLLRIDHRIAGLRVCLKLLRLRLAVRANFNPLQPRDRDDQWIKVGLEDGKPNELPRARTGNPRVDRTTDDLAEIALDVAKNVQGSKGAVFGIAVHTAFARIVRDLDLPGIGRDGVETTYKLGERNYPGP